jgi:hypothetical protein
VGIPFQVFSVEIVQQTLGIAEMQDNTVVWQNNLQFIQE